MIIKHLLAFAVLLVAPKAILFIQNKIVKYLENHMELSRAKLIGFFIKLGSFFVIGLIIAQTIGIEINTILGAAGVLTIAISFSMQTILTNLISGFLVLFEQSIKIKDKVLINKIEGTLINIGFLSSTIELKDGSHARVPNGDLLKFPFISLNTQEFQTTEIQFSIDKNEFEKFNKKLEKNLNEAIKSEFSLSQSVNKLDGSIFSGVIKVTGKEVISSSTLANIIAKSMN